MDSSPNEDRIRNGIGVNCEVAIDGGEDIEFYGTRRTSARAMEASAISSQLQTMWCGSVVSIVVGFSFFERT